MNSRISSLLFVIRFDKIVEDDYDERGVSVP